ncbi:MAG TPA: NAD(P)/FAD-dependent oxidoreductase [Anaerolineales bacterium]|nr:NAD(P)/FAD-dependent oxidoreductase [Anaerolineales bacterium]
MSVEHVDVLIVGAGLSGIGAAYYLQTHCPKKSYAILEGRNAIGGTWDLFRYPGVRSDSDMYTLGFSFRPWHEPQAIADGPSILAYIRETAQAYGIDQKIRFGHRVRWAEWSSGDMRWTVEAERASGEVVRLTCSFLYMCSGYYEYERGYMPEWPDIEQFAGQIVHPQQWPQDLDYAGKRVVVIGSGATAVTLVPAMAKQAAHVTMLQRSPTYVVSLPSEDATANWLRGHLPPRLAYDLVRWKNVLITLYYYNLMRRRPARMKQNLIELVRAQLGSTYDVDTHFSPRYNPWDQRMCFVPDGDLFNAINAGTVSVVTDHIDTFTPTGIRLRSGAELTADIIVTATGLVMKLMSGVELVVDGRPVELAQTMSYKGMMFSDIPNLAGAIGYTNASWTLKCELASQYVCRLLNFMDKHGYVQCTPRKTDPAITEEPILSFTSGYVQRALPSLPHQGSKRPWKLYQNYLLDMITFRLGRVDDGIMEFRSRQNATPAATQGGLV